MMRKLHFLSLSCCLIILAGCAEYSAKSALSSYLDALSAERYEEAYNYVASKDRANLPLNAYTAIMQTAGQVKSLFSAKEASYEIKSVTVNGNQASAMVSITRPQSGGLIHQSLSALTGSENQEKASPPAMITEDFPYRLVKEEGGWKVSL